MPFTQQYYDNIIPIYHWYCGYLSRSIWLFLIWMFIFPGRVRVIVARETTPVGARADLLKDCPLKGKTGNMSVLRTDWVWLTAMGLFMRSILYIVMGGDPGAICQLCDTPLGSSQARGDQEKWMPQICPRVDTAWHCTWLISGRLSACLSFVFHAWHTHEGYFWMTPAFIFSSMCFLWFVTPHKSPAYPLCKLLSVCLIPCLPAKMDIL